MGRRFEKTDAYEKTMEENKKIIKRNMIRIIAILGLAWTMWYIAYSWLKVLEKEQPNKEQKMGKRCLQTNKKVYDIFTNEVA